MNQSKAETWIKAGYKLFAREGIEGINVERLARILGLNKSGFYHYFGSKKGYLKSLVQYHARMAEAMAKDIAVCDNIDPDLLLLIIKHKTFVLVESQLLVKCKPTHFSEGFSEAGKIVSEEFLPLWGKATQLPEGSPVALAYLNIMRHFFYARINSENINYKFLRALAFETKGVMNKVFEMKRVSAQNMQESTQAK